jgi:alcohol dehydrogenase class IV
MKKSLGIPAKLSDLKTQRAVTRGDIPALVDVAINDTCHRTNPRPCAREDFERLFAAAI